MRSVAALFVSMVCALLALLASPDRAEAQPQSESARRWLEEGRTALRDLRYADAVQLFERALAIEDDLVTLYNLGLAHRAQNHCRQATAIFRRVEATSRVPRDRRDAHELLGELRRCAARVTLRVAGQPAEVTVDGEAHRIGDGDHELQLDPGRHLFAVRRDGFDAVRVEQVLQRGQRVVVSLDARRGTPQAGRLVVETGSEASVLTIDGVRQVTASGTFVLQPGAHRVVVAYPGQTPQSRDFDLTPGARVVHAFSPLHVAGSSSLATRWWFWAIVGATVVGAGVATYFIVQPTPEPYNGTWGSTVLSIRVAP